MSTFSEGIVLANVTSIRESTVTHGSPYIAYTCPAGRFAVLEIVKLGTSSAFIDTFITLSGVENQIHPRTASLLEYFKDFRVTLNSGEELKFRTSGGGSANFDNVIHIKEYLNP